MFHESLYYDTKKKVLDKRANLTQKEADTNSQWKGDVGATGAVKVSCVFDYRNFSVFCYSNCDRIFLFGTLVLIGRFLPEKIMIVTQGCATVADGGVAVPLTIRVANQNSVAVEGVTLYITISKRCV